MSLLDFIFRPKKRRRRQAYEEAATAIETYIGGRGGPWDWDDFTSIKEKDEFLEPARLRCSRVGDDFPPREKGRYCSDDGLEVLRAIAVEIREKMPQITNEETA